MQQRLHRRPSSSSSSDPIPTPSSSTPPDLPLPSQSSSTLPDWNNVSIIHRNTLPPRATFTPYPSTSSAYLRRIPSPFSQKLSGRWSFHHSTSPLSGPRDFYEVGYAPGTAEGWSEVEVPGMWQLQGFGRPQYTNYDYPWPVDPPRVLMEGNECGRYLRVFSVTGECRKGKDRRLRLHFEGVDSGFSVWVNGVYVGYSQGARNPSEFDVCDVVNDGENTLAVEVYQRCDGSYLEDQDQWWLSGIFRHVWLLAFPASCPRDIYARPLFEHRDYSMAQLLVDIEAPGRESYSLDLYLRDPSGDTARTGEAAIRMGQKVASSKVACQKGTNKLALPVENPMLWTAETPVLYTLVVVSGTGCSVAMDIGFREVAIIDNVFCVNGQPVKLRGVNYHENNAKTGRAVPDGQAAEDLSTMKRYNINAIRLSHYPHRTQVYELANQLGFYIMDEADLECHGFGVAGGAAESFTTDNPDWEAAYIDRAVQMVARDKNHCCIVMWSLGNESFFGRNHRAMAKWIREFEPGWIIHYEGDGDAEVADVVSRMYASHQEVEEMGKGTGKPVVLCEFGHAMGTGPGGLKEYVESFFKWKRLMGGFVWEWANHGLERVTPGGIEIAYGGDFGDDPNDGNFVLDGLCDSYHRPGMGLEEYKVVISPVEIRWGDGVGLVVKNRFDHLTLDGVRFGWRWIWDGGGQIENGGLFTLTDVNPGEELAIDLPGNLRDLPGFEQFQDVHLELDIFDKDSQWLDTTTLQLPLHHLPARVSLFPLLLSPTTPDTVPTVDQVGQNIHVTSTEGTLWTIDTTVAALSGWQRPDGTEVLAGPVTVGFYRALTDNDRLCRFGRHWHDRRLHQARWHGQSVVWQRTAEGVRVEIRGRVAPPVLAWGVDVAMVLMFAGEGVSVHVTGIPKGVLCPESWPRIGLDLSVNVGEEEGRAKWWGRGPGPSYRDMKMAGKMGQWEMGVEELFTELEYPQETSNRTDVGWMEVLEAGGGEGKRVIKANYQGHEGGSFCAMRYTAEDVDEAKHKTELRKMKRETLQLRLDWVHHGLGTGSCGPETLPQYQLLVAKEEVFEFDIGLE